MESAPSSTVEVTVNGQPRQVPQGLSVDRLLTWLEIKQDRVAVERNRAIVRRAEWAATLVEPGDQLEIVWFVGGGV
jgi:thiamine biosynthesis protein ThiS